ncbi:MAG: leucine-rich repeat domain-containing protein [Prevotella sp.]|nr:leucine-rich repeat domain-containing protein [Prevotella sp.]
MKTYMNEDKKWGKQILRKVLSVCVFLFMGSYVAWAEVWELRIMGHVYEFNDDTNTGRLLSIEDKSLTSTFVIKSITHIEHPNGAYYVTSIADDCFVGCDKLEEVSIPESVLTLGDRCFANCTCLKTITIHKDMRHLGRDCFAGCSSLSSVDIQSEKLEGIPEGCFNGCTNLQQMIIRMKNPPVAILSKAGLDQFAGAKPMTYLYVPQESADAYKESSLWKCWENIIPTDFEAMDELESKQLKELSDGRFVDSNANHNNSHYYSLNHENLTATFLQARPNNTGKADWFECLFNITIPEFVYYNHQVYTVTALGDGCFRDCIYLSEVNIPSTVKDLGSFCFTFSMPAVSLVLPEGVKTLGAGCFLESYIRKIDLPASLTSLGRRCFAESIQLESVSLRSGNISTISQGCFDSCHRLSEFICYANQVPTLEYDGEKSPFYGTRASEGTLYVQKDLVDAYKATEGWNDWKNVLPIDAYGQLDGIDNMTRNVKDDADIYDLQGRKVTTPKKNGIYIKNGKKFVVH